MLGRLFERLQQTVERGLREHVHFVDDVDFGPRHDRAVTGVVDDLADVVDARVRGGVHFEHVDMARVDDRLTVDAELLHMDRRLIDRGPRVSCRQFIVERARENAGGRRLADAAHAGQQIGLMNSVEIECVFERAHHRLLADQVYEGGRSIFARQHAIGRRRRLIGAKQRRSVIGRQRWPRRIVLVVHLHPSGGRRATNSAVYCATPFAARRRRWEAERRPAQAR